jgi:predicted dehydrogenase
MKIAVVGCKGFGRVHLNALSESRRDRELEVYVFSRTEKYAKECYKEFDTKAISRATKKS